MTADRGDAQPQLLIALTSNEVAFIVIGGHAVAAHGFARTTRDVAIVFATTSDSCGRFARALVDMQASIAVADSPAPGGQITGSWLAKGGQFVFRTQYGLLDAFSWIAGQDYDSLAAGTITARLADGTALRVCGYRDLVAMKQRAGRPRDEEDLNHLAALNPDR